MVSFEDGGGEKVSGIPGACATRDFTYLLRGPWKGRTQKLTTQLDLIGPITTVGDSITLQTLWNALVTQTCNICMVHATIYIGKCNTCLNFLYVF